MQHHSGIKGPGQLRASLGWPGIGASNRDFGETCLTQKTIHNTSAKLQFTESSSKSLHRAKPSAAKTCVAAETSTNYLSKHQTNHTMMDTLRGFQSPASQLR